MDKFFVIANREKEESERTGIEILEYLKGHQKECVLQARKSSSDIKKTGLYHYTEIEEIPEGTECILTLGGDGTLIQAARDTVETKIPLLGVNIGTLGFLAEIEKSGLFVALDCLMNDEYSVEDRMMLKGSIVQNQELILEDRALNDIVINRTGPLCVMDFEIYVNGELLNICTADGIIVSTPTGSTGYNLSAGGPIVSPKAEMILLTPICSHSLHARSIILSKDDEIRIRIGERKKQRKTQALVTFDGETSVVLQSGDWVEVKKSRQKTNILKISNMGFLEVLRNKMKES